MVREDTASVDNGYSHLLATFVTLDEQKRDLEKHLKEVTEEREKIEVQLLDHFIEMGQQNAKVRTETGFATVYINSQLWAGAKDGDMDALCHALVSYSDDLATLVHETVNSQTLSAWVREQDKDELGNVILPEPLAEVINVSKRINLRVRRS